MKVNELRKLELLLSRLLKEEVYYEDDREFWQDVLNEVHEHRRGKQIIEERGL